VILVGEPTGVLTHQTVGREAIGWVEVGPSKCIGEEIYMGGIRPTAG